MKKNTEYGLSLMNKASERSERGLSLMKAKRSERAFTLMNKASERSERAFTLMNMNSERSERGLSLMKAMRTECGLSLIEILIVVTIFAVLGLLISTSLILTMRGTKKSESIVKVRENLNYAMAVIERNIRNANSIKDCEAMQPSEIFYYDQNGQLTSFSCKNDETANYVASGSGALRITSEDIDLTYCNFSCTNTNPQSVVIDLAGRSVNTDKAEGSSVSLSSTIYLRNNF